MTIEAPDLYEHTMTRGQYMATVRRRPAPPPPGRGSYTAPAPGPLEWKWKVMDALYESTGFTINDIRHANDQSVAHPVRRARINAGVAIHRGDPNITWAGVASFFRLIIVSSVARWVDQADDDVVAELISLARSYGD